VGLKGNVRADQLCCENGIELHEPARPSDFLLSSSDMGRYAYSIWPVVSFMPWFRYFDGDQVIISMMNRMIANHLCLRSHLGRIGIVESPMCVCSWDYQTGDHVLAWLR
jgi:hypothetical protein